MLKDRPGVLVDEHNCALTLECQVSSGSQASHYQLIFICVWCRCLFDRVYVVLGQKSTGEWGQGMPQKSHYAMDVTQEIYCEAGKRPPLRVPRER